MKILEKKTKQFAEKPSLSEYQFVDNGKAIMSEERAHTWTADDRVEDDYLDTPLDNRICQHKEKGCDPNPCLK